MWKLLAFSRVISEWAELTKRGPSEGNFEIEVISIGDAQHERQALLHITEEHDVRFVPKSIKLIERPTVDELKQQHEVMLSKLTLLLTADSSLDMMYHNGTFVDHPSVANLERPHTIPLQFSGRKRARFHSPPRVSHSRGH
jgi:hypothetical protein